MKKNLFVTVIMFTSLVFAHCGGDEEPGDQLDSSLRFTREISSRVDHNKRYTHRLSATSDDSDEIVYKILRLPRWMTYDTSANTLSGIPGWDNKDRSFLLHVQATDGIDTITQSQDIEVVFANIICDQNFGDPDESDYILPYTAGVTSEILQSYCNPTNSHNNTFAYDFLLEMGEDILASRGGTVLEVQGSLPDGTGESGKENFVYIQHDDLSVIRYVHLQQHSVTVSKGDKVTQGDVIGKNGLSGGTPVPHLHFELFREFTWSDKRYALPINFRNSEGDLDSNNGLIVGHSYRAK